MQYFLEKMSCSKPFAKGTISFIFNEYLRTHTLMSTDFIKLFFFPLRTQITILGSCRLCPYLLRYDSDDEEDGVEVIGL